MRRLPFGALIYFEAVARHLKFKSAAEELNVSQGAVSQQIKTLEEWLGCPLFVRNARELRLTRAGEGLLPGVTTAIRELETAISDVARQGRRRTLRLASLPTLSTRWLIPRLHRFHRDNPEIAVEVVTLPADFVRHGSAPDLDGVGADVAITYGHGSWVGFDAQKLFDEVTVMVASPTFLRRRPIRSAADLAGCPLIQHTTRRNAWRVWASTVGPRGLAHGEGPRFEHFYMVREAAIAGIGVALIPRFLVAADLASGRLVAPLEVSLQTDQAYFAVWPTASGPDRAIRRFAAWLAAETSDAADGAAAAPTARAAAPSETAAAVEAAQNR